MKDKMGALEYTISWYLFCPFNYFDKSILCNANVLKLAKTVFLFRKLYLEENLIGFLTRGVFIL